jgi:acyl-CoA thioesterase
MSPATHPVFELARDVDGFRVDVPDGWMQGRGVFGGLVAGWMVRAAELCEPEPERVVRTLSVQIVGPVQPGEALLKGEALREGSGVSTRAVRLEQGGVVLAHAVVSHGRFRVPGRDFAVGRAPSVPPASEVDVAQVEPPLGPQFAQNLEFRPVSGLPMSAPGELANGAAHSLGYVRFKLPPPVVDVASLAAIADAYWPAIYVTEEALRPMATLAFTLDVHVDPATLDPSRPLLVETRAVAGCDGFVLEDRRVYADDGRLVASNRQTFVIIK